MYFSYAWPSAQYLLDMPDHLPYIIRICLNICQINFGYAWKSAKYISCKSSNVKTPSTRRVAIKQRIGKTTTQHCVDGGGSNLAELFKLKPIFKICGSTLIQIVKLWIEIELANSKLEIPPPPSPRNVALSRCKTMLVPRRSRSKLPDQHWICVGFLSSKHFYLRKFLNHFR